MTDLVFLKALRDKLKGGNIRSIHLNALPGRYATRLDLGNLNYIEPGFAEKFLQKLFTQACFEFQVSFDNIDLNSIQAEEQKRLGLLSKRLNSINIENEDNYKEHGIKTFSFGYPMLIKTSKQDPKKIIKAPLFIWPLEIIKSANKINTWSILRNKTRNENGKIVDEEIHSVGLNEVLISFLKNDENIVIPQINEELLEDAVISREELIAECVKVLRALNANASADMPESLTIKLNAPVGNIPEAAGFESVAGNSSAWIHFGGVFGLYRTQKESIITDIDILIERFDRFEFENLKVENFSGTAHSAVETDPSQQEILTSLGIEPKKIIQGPPGTGKSQSLTALITNALANNLKCLVVCEKKTALDVVKNNLLRTNPQLGELACVVEDINKDRDGIVNTVRDKLGNLSNIENFNTVLYHSVKEEVEKNAQMINLQHRDLDSNINQGKKWTELVGLFLKRQKVADFSLLKGQLDYKDFHFDSNERELPELIEKIKLAKKLYREIDRLDHPLEILHDEIFSEEIPVAVQEGLEKTIAETRAVIKPVTESLNLDIDNYSKWLDSFYEGAQNEIVQLIEILQGEIADYKKWLEQHYENYYHGLKLKINEYKSFVKAGHDRFGDKLYNNNGITRFEINLFSRVFKKYKDLKSVRNYLLEGIEKIKTVHQSLDYIGHHYLPEIDIRSFQPFVENVDALETAADNWYTKNLTERKAAVETLSSATCHKGYAEYVFILRQTEKKISGFKDYISKDEKIWYPNYAIENHAQSIKALSDLTEQLNNRQEFKKDYEEQIASSKLHGLYTQHQEIITASESLFDGLVEDLNRHKILKKALSKVDGHHGKIAVAEHLDTDLDTIGANLAGFRTYFEWRRYYISLNPLEKKIILALINIKAADWATTFESWYYYWLLSIAESRLKSLPRNDDTVIELQRLKNQFKINQVRSIIFNWSGRQMQSAQTAVRRGINPTSLFNKRGARGERRNSLRRIIQTDFNLFTDFFPVVMISPTVCSSIIPLTEGLFDLVIFDEASQLRLEDTFPALLRGRIKVISGDSQQMPPSNFFQGGAALLNPTEEDYNEELTEQEQQENNRRFNSSLDLADSESLLVYAENSGYKQSYLKIHYRSQHPYLIDFSNHAFYGKRLIPMPPKHDYRPISFVRVDGVYEEQVNKDEARQVVDILLNHIKPFKNGQYPSVGIATFNLYQRNLILEEIIKVRQQSPEHDKKITDLGNDLFVKNLENIQGDERDIIIISTTFGRKSDGSFRQMFGPILQGNGYKLLNVIITRAKYKTFLCTSIPQEYINQYNSLLQAGKNNGRAVFYAYLAYAKAVSEADNETRVLILDQLYKNCEAKIFEPDRETFGSESPFEEEVYNSLALHLDPARLEQQYKVGGFKIDLVVKSKNTGQPVIAIECDGAKYHSSNEAYAWDMFRQSQLEQYGFIFYRIWSTNWWHSQERELNKLLNFINDADQHEILQENLPVEELLKEEQIKPVAIIVDTKNKVTIDSLVTLKNPEGKIIKVRFSKVQATEANKPDSNGVMNIFYKSALALGVIGKSEGETCQLGMLELYYQILAIQ